MSGRIFKGCDQQGRYPQAAESVTSTDVKRADAQLLREVLTDIAIVVGLLALVVGVPALITVLRNA